MKGVDLIFPSLPLHKQVTCLEHSKTGKNCYLCISVSLKYSTFHWPRDTVLRRAAETTCEGGSTTHSIPPPLYCSFSPLSVPPLCWCDITLLGHQISQSHRGDTLLTSWLLYLLNWMNFPLIWGLRLPAVILTSHLLKTETKREKVCNLVKVKRHVTEESWLTSSCTCRSAHLTLMVE